MDSDDDPGLARLRELALALPGAREKRVVSIPAFFTKKVFAYWGMPYKLDGHVLRRPNLSVLLPDAERLALLQSGRAHIPMYIGPHGWVGIVVDASSDWAELAELVEESFRKTAPKRLVAELDAR